MSYDFKAKNNFNDKSLMEFLELTNVTQVSIYCDNMSATVFNPKIYIHNVLIFEGKDGSDVVIAPSNFDNFTLERVSKGYLLTFENSSYNHCVITFECDDELIDEYFENYEWI
jgi:hypothetical protein